MGPETCIAGMPPGDADAAGPGTHSKDVDSSSLHIFSKSAMPPMSRVSFFTQLIFIEQCVCVCVCVCGTVLGAGDSDMS